MIKTFTCKRCGKEFTKETRSYAYYCPECYKLNRKERAYKHAVEIGRIKKPGVGSGGNQYGSSNPAWTNYKGEYSYRNLIKDLKQCEMCGATTNLCRHHINFIRSDNRLENLVVVCRKCHTKLHRLKINYTSRIKTTLNGGTNQDNPVPSYDVTGLTTIPDECKGVETSVSKDVAVDNQQKR